MNKTQDCSYNLYLRIRCIVKITAVFLFLSIFQVSASIYSQEKKISVSVENGTFYEFVSQIEKQSEFMFFYKGEEINSTIRVNLNAKNKLVSEILDAVTEANNLSYKITGKHIIITKNSPEKQKKRKITGVITDNAGEPIIGATIAEKGTSNGTITDMDGKFVLQDVPEKGILVVTYVGFASKEIVLNEKTKYEVKLSESGLDLDEVVVVGYGTQKKVNLTGAISSLKGEELVKRQVGQASMLLQGIAPGVTVTQSSGQPGADGGTIRIRGVGTIQSGADPMVLVDGVEMSMVNVDPNIIENISVLKDAASAAIYGSRAANGVILITTKRAASEKPTFNYNGYVGIQNPTALPKKVNAMDHMLLFDESRKNQELSPTYSETIEKYKEYASSNPDLYPDTDWQDAILKTGLQQNHFLSLSAGNETLKVLASLGYFNQTGIIDNTKFERFSMRVNTDMKITKWLTSKFDVYLRYHTKTDPSVGVEETFFQMNRLPATLLGVLSDGRYGDGATGFNPIAWTKERGTTSQTVPNAMVNINLLIKPVSWMTVDLSVAPYFRFYHTKDYTKAVMLYTGDGEEYGPNPAVGKLTEKYTRTHNISYKGTTEFQKELGQHSFKALLGASREIYSNNWFSAYRENFVLPQYDVLNAGGETNKNNGGSGTEWALQSFFGRVNYDFEGKYLFEMNMRADGSSRFAKGNKYSYFPSVSAGWRISEEDFMLSLKEQFLDNLKVRLSWGKLGNQEIGDTDYPFVSTISLDNPYSFGGNLASGALMTDMANELLQWETTEMYNIGLDAGLFNGLSITADYYYKKSYNILMKIDIPGILGLEKPYQNLGEVSNKGWEIGVSYQNKSGDFTYRLGANLSDVINKVEDIKGVEMSKNNLQQIREGYSINSLYGFVAEGLYTTPEDVASRPQYGNETLAPGDIKYRNLNDDDVIDNSDRAIIGETIPRYTYGFNLDLGYKGFDLSMFLQGVGKRDGYLYGSAVFPFYSGATAYEHQKDRWTTENQNVNATFPRLTIGLNNNVQNSSFWVKDASYLRLKNIQLGYTFPKKWISPLSVDHLRVYLTAENLLTIDDFWDGFDVEAPVGNGNYYPHIKSWSIGLNVRF